MTALGSGPVMPPQRIRRGSGSIAGERWFAPAVPHGAGPMLLSASMQSTVYSEPAATLTLYISIYSGTASTCILTALGSGPVMPPQRIRRGSGSIAGERWFAPAVPHGAGPMLLSASMQSTVYSEPAATLTLYISIYSGTASTCILTALGSGPVMPPQRIRRGSGSIAGERWFAPAVPHGAGPMLLSASMQSTVYSEPAATLTLYISIYSGTASTCILTALGSGPVMPPQRIRRGSGSIAGERWFAPAVPHGAGPMLLSASMQSTVYSEPAATLTLYISIYSGTASTCILTALGSGPVMPPQRIRRGSGSIAGERWFAPAVPHGAGPMLLSASMQSTVYSEPAATLTLYISIYSGTASTCILTALGSGPVMPPQRIRRGSGSIAGERWFAPAVPHGAGPMLLSASMQSTVYSEPAATLTLYISIYSGTASTCILTALGSGPVMPPQRIRRGSGSIAGERWFAPAVPHGAGPMLLSASMQSTVYSEPAATLTLYISIYSGTASTCILTALGSGPVMPPQRIRRGSGSIAGERWFAPAVPHGAGPMLLSASMQSTVYSEPAATLTLYISIYSGTASTCILTALGSGPVMPPQRIRRGSGSIAGERWFAPAVPHGAGPMLLSASMQSTVYSEPAATLTLYISIYSGTASTCILTALGSGPVMPPQRIRRGSGSIAGERWFAPAVPHGAGPMLLSASMQSTVYSEPAATLTLYISIYSGTASTCILTALGSGPVMPPQRIRRGSGSIAGERWFAPAVPHGAGPMLLSASMQSTVYSEPAATLTLYISIYSGTASTCILTALGSGPVMPPQRIRRGSGSIAGERWFAPAVPHGAGPMLLSASMQSTVYSEPAATLTLYISIYSGTASTCILTALGSGPVMPPQRIRRGSGSIAGERWFAPAVPHGAGPMLLSASMQSTVYSEPAATLTLYISIYSGTASTCILTALGSGPVMPPQRIRRGSGSIAGERWFAPAVPHGAGPMLLSASMQSTVYSEPAATLTLYISIYSGTASTCILTALGSGPVMPPQRIRRGSGSIAGERWFAPAVPHGAGPMLLSASMQSTVYSEPAATLTLYISIYSGTASTCILTALGSGPVMPPQRIRRGSGSIAGERWFAPAVPHGAGPMLLSASMQSTVYSEPAATLTLYISIYSGTASTCILTALGSGPVMPPQRIRRGSGSIAGERWFAPAVPHGAGPMLLSGLRPAIPPQNETLRHLKQPRLLYTFLHLLRMSYPLRVNGTNA
ncbi:hypothetical protein Tcan_02732 [Toxocara canis]|uniref:Uncharacterized protein n=1 Tax=Toxocara canis TaxID=6265 RepID=A0A0B2UYC7_TOXCA|nr:hypothetical protein Tcan_02732 [Toxocara canis]